VSSTLTAMPGSMSCSWAIGLLRPPDGRTCGANSLMSTPPPAHRSPKKRSIALVSSTRSRRRSTVHPPSSDNSSANCSPSRLPGPWPLWAERTVRQLSRKSELAQAFRYMRARWPALVRCFDDGRLAPDNNPAERALRCVAIGRKNYPKSGSWTIARWRRIGANHRDGDRNDEAGGSPGG
jgi:Transposase IS66 family